MLDMLGDSDRGRQMVLAAADLTWWWVGYAIGGAVVLVVAALVIALIVTAKSIASAAEDAVRSLESARDRTEALWQIRQTNTLARQIRDGAVTARKALGG